MEGRYIWHVIEVQSDWAAEQKRLMERTQIERGEEVPDRFYAERAKQQDHPLLQDYERLTLKAAIQHAIDQGAKHIALSDAETAMMTEGHDRLAYNPETIHF